MTTAESLDDLRAVWRELGVPAPRPVKVRIEPTRTTDAEHLASLLAGQGWVTFTDEVVRLDGPLPRERRVVAAEVATGPEQARSVIWDGERWQITTVAEGDGEGAHEALAFDVFHVTDRGPNGRGRLHYVVYWTREDDRDLKVWQPRAARWVGFAQEEAVR